MFGFMGRVDCLEIVDGEVEKSSKSAFDFAARTRE